MLQNAPRASEGKIIKLVHSAPNRRKRPLDEAVKFRNPWPFTVAAPFGLMPLQDGFVRAADPSVVADKTTQDIFYLGYVSYTINPATGVNHSRYP